MKSEEQILAKLEQNVAALEQLDAKYPSSTDPMIAEDVEAQMAASLSVIILAWVLDLENEVSKNILVARAKASLAGVEVVRGG